MKPQRLRMTHDLILNYGLYKKMEVWTEPFFSPPVLVFALSLLRTIYL
jgi:hypothetical protein